MAKFRNHQIHGRKVRFDFAQTPRHWVPDDVLTTHVLNGMHVLLPAVEHWFCRLANQSLPYVTDAALRADLKGFVAQEGAHAKAHLGAESYFAAHGIDASRFKARLDWLFRNLLNDTPLGLRGPFTRWPRQWLALRMGGIACLEHYFCFLGTWALQARALDDSGADPAMLDLVRWHAAEEVEHRTVAFDAYRALAGEGLSAYLGRQAPMALAFPAIIGVWLAAARHLAQADGDAAARGLAAQSWPARLLNYQRHARRSGRLPTLGHFLQGLAIWVRPGHHPEQDGDPIAAQAYLARSPAAQAAAA